MRIGVSGWYRRYGARDQSLEAIEVVNRRSDRECIQSWIVEWKKSLGEKAVAIVEEWKVVVGSRHLPSVRRPRKRMESSGVAVGFARPSSAVLTVQSLVRVAEDMKKNVGVAAVDNSPGWVDRWVAG